MSGELNDLLPIKNTKRRTKEERLKIWRCKVLRKKKVFLCCYMVKSKSKENVTDNWLLCVNELV
jgi:hypothetical protein